MESVRRALEIAEPRRTRRPKDLWEGLFYHHLRKANVGQLRLRFGDEQTVYTLGGTAAGPQVELWVRHAAFFRRCVVSGEIGFGEAYVDGLWGTEDLRGVLAWFLMNARRTPTFSVGRLTGFTVNLLGWVERLRHARRRNSRAGSQRNISEHYDLSNEFFSLMLDETMAYSAGVFPGPESTLYEAQVEKFRRLLERLEIGPEHHLLEIGTGWGGFAVYAAEQSGCRVTTVTISREQFRHVQTLVRSRGLDHLIEVRLQDYRDIEGSFDRIVSIEMVEALGREYLDTFFAKCAQVLRQDGIMVLQAITFPDPYYDRYVRSVDWTQKYIFPGSLLLSLRETLNALHRTSDLMVWSSDSVGLHYARTLAEWRKNVLANEDRIRSLGFDDAFLRKWIYYLTFCEVGFAHRYINDMQLVLSRPLNQTLFQKLEAIRDGAGAQAAVPQEVTE